MITNRDQYDFVKIPDDIIVDNQIMPVRADPSEMRGIDLIFLDEAVNERIAACYGGYVPDENSKTEFENIVQLRPVKNLYKSIQNLNSTTNFFNIPKDFEFPVKIKTENDQYILQNAVGQEYGLNTYTKYVDPEYTLVNGDEFRKKYIMDMFKDVKSLNGFCTTYSVYSEIPIKCFSYGYSQTDKDARRPFNPAYMFNPEYGANIDSAYIVIYNYEQMTDPYSYYDSSNQLRYKTVGGQAYYQANKDVFEIKKLDPTTIKYADIYTVILKLNTTYSKELYELDSNGSRINEETSTLYRYFYYPIQASVQDQKLIINCSQLNDAIQYIKDQINFESYYMSKYSEQRLAISIDGTIPVFKMNNRTDLENT